MFCTSDIDDAACITFQQSGYASSNKDRKSREIDVDGLVPASLKRGILVKRAPTDRDASIVNKDL